MYEMFSKEKTYILPNGKSYTGLDLFENSQYPLTNFETCVVDVKNGMITSFGLLNDLAENYGIDISEKTYDDVILEINAIIVSINRSQVTKELRSDSMLKVAQITALSFTDEQAIEVVDLYPEYEIDHAYKQNDRFQYNGSLYKVNQNHTSAAQWVPGETGTESLYTNLMLDESGYQIWKQPTGAHDAYNTGDIVRYPDKDGKLYKSLIDGNVYSPDTYPQGWEIYTEE